MIYVVCIFKYFGFGALRDNSLSTREIKLAELANSVDFDEVAHNDPPHTDLHCLPSSV